MNNTYAKQAEDFLAKTGVSIKKTFIACKPYFPEDQVSRNVWRISLYKGLVSHSFTFGDSIAATRKGLIPPNDYNILADLNLNFSSFKDIDDMASEYGITRPSEALRVWEALEEMEIGLRQIFTDEELEQLREIQ